jgi:hypothetical protein
MMFVRRKTRNPGRITFARIELFVVVPIIAALPHVVAGAADPLNQPDLAPVEAKAPPAHAPVELVRDGRAAAVVYVAPPVSAFQRKRAFETLLKELVEVVRLSTGATLPVVDEMPAPGQPAIVIGDCDASRAAGIEARTLPYEGFVVKTAANRVFLVGSTRKLEYETEMAHHGKVWPSAVANEGDAWAVADFLERFVGVRWYWPAEALGRSLVETPSLAVPPVHYHDAPVFRFRDFGLFKRVRTIASKDFYVGRWFDRQKPALPVPAGVEVLTPPWAQLREGCSWPYQISVHSLPVSEERPLCSQALIDYMLKGAEQYWDRNETHGGYLVGGGRVYVTPDSIHVSYPDAGVNPDHVHEEFRPLLKAGTWGGASHVMGLTVKMLAEQVARRWPEKKVLYLPYWHYVTAPDIEFPANLEIQLCLTHTDGMAGMAEPRKRAMNDANIRAWSAQAGGRIGLWDYAGPCHNDTYAPLQHPHLVQQFYRQHREHVAGGFVDSTSSPVLWSRSAPTIYVWTRVLWNPDVNVDAVLDEWCRRLFAPAAGTTRELLKLMCDRWEKSAWTRSKGQSVGLGGAGVVFSDKWPPAVVKEMDALRRRALAELKNDPRARQRFQYWMGDGLWQAFLGEAELAWEDAGIIPRKPRITTFRFPHLDPPATGTIIKNIGGRDGEGNALRPFGREIRVTVPAGTDRTALRPHIYADVAAIHPESGRPQDFTKPVTYTVTYENGAAAQYVVYVTEE